MVEELPEDIAALRRLEQGWWWLNGALHAVAQLKADGPQSIGKLREQARMIDRKRVAISVRLAEISAVGKDSGDRAFSRVGDAAGAI